MKILAQEIKFDILCLNETKLDARIDDDDICIQDIHLIEGIEIDMEVELFMLLIV